MTEHKQYEPKNDNWLTAAQIAAHFGHRYPIDVVYKYMHAWAEYGPWVAQKRCDDAGRVVLCMSRYWLPAFGDELKHNAVGYIHDRYIYDWRMKGARELGQYINASRSTIDEKMHLYQASMPNVIKTDISVRKRPYPVMAEEDIDEFCNATGLTHHAGRIVDTTPREIPADVADAKCDGWVAQFLPPQTLAAFVNASPTRIYNLLHMFIDEMPNDIKIVNNINGMASIRLRKESIDKFCMITGVGRCK